MSMKTELRLTDTNAASDSKGRTWGLEGGLVLVAHRRHRRGHHRVLCPARRPERSSLTMSFLVALVPVLVCLAYIFGLRQGKPPGYDRDCFEYLSTDAASARRPNIPAPIHFYES